MFARSAGAGENSETKVGALTAIAVRIGLDLAPNAGVAFAVVMRAVSDSAAQWASSQGSPDANLTDATMIYGTTIH
jgi:hypothetical protein